MDGRVPERRRRPKPGRSGNPSGRPEGGATSVARVVQQELERLVAGDPGLGDEGPITRRRRLVRALLDAIERCDARAAKSFRAPERRRKGRGEAMNPERPPGVLEDRANEEISGQAETRGGNYPAERNDDASLQDPRIARVSGRLTFGTLRE